MTWDLEELSRVLNDDNFIAAWFLRSILYSVLRSILRIYLL